MLIMQSLHVVSITVFSCVSKAGASRLFLLTHGTKNRFGGAHCKTIFKHITFIKIGFRYPVLCPCNDDITRKGALEIVLYTYFLHYCAKLVFKSLRNKVATLQWKITALSRTALIQVQCKVNAERPICQYNLGSQVSKIIT